MTTGWTVRDRIPGGRDFPPVQTGPGAHPASCKMVTGSFPRVQCGRGVLLTNHPLLVPQSWKSRAIPLPTLWGTPDLYREHFTFYSIQCALTCLELDEFLTYAKKKKIADYWNLTSFILLNTPHQFREIYYLDIRDRFMRTLILISPALRHDIFKTLKIFFKKWAKSDDISGFEYMQTCIHSHASTHKHRHTM